MNLAKCRPQRTLAQGNRGGEPEQSGTDGAFSDLVMRYVESNPVRGGLARAPEDYS
jgi:hypothetical protein